jgi:hypothetical protein
MVDDVPKILPSVTKNENKLSTRVSRIFSMSVSLASGLFKAKQFEHKYVKLEEWHERVRND